MLFWTEPSFFRFSPAGENIRWERVQPNALGRCVEPGRTATTLFSGDPKKQVMQAFK